MELFKISFIAYMFVTLGRKGLIFYPYQWLISHLPGWLRDPLGGCFMCFTGQVCFWYFIITKRFDFFELVFFTFAGIGISLIYDKIFRWLYDT